MNDRARRAERLVQNAVTEIFGLVVVRRAIRTRFASVDIFGADIVGKSADGKTYYVQVTTGGAQAVSARRRKLEAVPWSCWDFVYLARVVRRGRRNVILLSEYIHQARKWSDWQELAIEKRWMTATRRSEVQS